MKLDAAEWTGNGAAFALHVALVAALSLSLAKPNRAPEAPAIFVEFVDEVGLDSRAPDQVSAAAAQAALDDLPDDAVPPPPDEVEPVDTPPPPPRTASETPTPPQTPTRPRPRPRGERLEGILDGVRDGNSRTGQAETGQAAAPTFDANAQASVAAVIQRQVQPCANRQIDPGPGANRIRVVMQLNLTRDGRLSRTPRVVRTEGVTPDNARYEQRVRDLAVAAYQGCAPYDGLPPELYSTPSGGWSEIRASFRLP
ncbi:hypothetical protein [Sphingomicrobium sediminis]|uniref:Cell envelope biogenesis protein TolA n=1 Tax=Sphingomicrobium sediminis TaxID=2950949 RepID=A0A9X2EI08_9SPHN|nr:hypothetical protein [Sphingomicrobium sediminis]MCM8558420.1 hypothetical protein [Sphingomicrobium sediminis]